MGADGGDGGAQITTDTEEPLPKTLPELLRFYENTLGTLGPILQDSIANAYKAYPIAWIVEAIRAAKMAQVYRWRYVEAILQRWGKEGFQAVPVALPVARDVPVATAQSIRRRYG